MIDAKKMITMEINAEYRNQEELYKRIVNQYGRDSRGVQCFNIADTGTSFLLENTLLRKREHIYVAIGLPITIKEGATSQVNMMAYLTDFSDQQRFRGNDNNEDASYWDGLESMINTLEKFKVLRDTLYAPKNTDDTKYYRRSGCDEIDVRLTWTDEGPEYVYTIPTETERDLIHLVTDFRLVYSCPRNLHPDGREKWQLSYLYRNG